jgi:L-amino acid N-acyltransferase YncA
MDDRRIDSEITLIPYYPNEAAALPWYQDAELCRQVDNRPEPYTPERLRAMYAFLASHGKCYYIEYRGELVGDVTLKDDGEIAIVVCTGYQNRGIGRRCVREMVALARESGMREVRANIYAFNAQSRRMFQSVGFEQIDEEWYRLCL